MNNYFSEDSQRIIVNAKKEMYELKHPYVGSEHLMLSILHSKLGLTNQLLSYGVSYELFKKELIKVVGVGSKSNDWFLFTPLLKKILFNASYYSSPDTHFIEPESILLSILKEGDGVADRILINMGIDLDMIIDKLSIQSSERERKNLSILNELGVNMNERSLMNQYDPVIGRDKQVLQIMQNLLRKNKNNPLLIGEAGVGKTAIVEELARRIVLGDVPSALKDKVIYSISMSHLVAGTKYRGEFEEKLHKLIEEVVVNPNIILFIDEVHTLMGAGGAEGAIDASNIVKPFLARGDIKIIGATTVKEYNDTIHKDKALDRRFQKIYIQEATLEEVKTILKELRPIYEEFHRVLLTDEILNLIVELSNSCIFSGRQPDKTIDLLDEVCSYVTLYRNKNDAKLSLYAHKIIEVEKQKNDEILRHNFKDAIYYREKEKKLKSIYNSNMFRKDHLKKIEVVRDDLYNVIYDKVRVDNPSKWSLKIEKNRKYLKQLLIGQNKVIDEVMNLLKKYDYIKNKETLSILLVGKKGVGKTFLVNKLIEDLFNDSNCITINMSEYKDSHLISKIIGTSPGYVGYQDTYLFQSIQENPFSIIFLDNIDKAHPSIVEQLLDSFSQGYLVNSYGENINLSKCIVFLCISSRDRSLGFSKGKDIELSFKYSRIKNIVYYNDIDETMIRNYLKLRVSKLDESRKRCNIIKEGMKVDWRERGFHSVCDFLEKEMV